jgi:hypothetical protein
MDVRQEVAHGLSKVSLGPVISLPFYGLMAVSRMATHIVLQGGQPAAVFYPLGHPTLYARTIREGVSTDGRKFHTGPLCLTLIRPDPDSTVTCHYGVIAICPADGQSPHPYIGRPGRVWSLSGT